MTRLLLSTFLGAVMAAAAWSSARGLFRAPLFARRNVRDVDVPVGAGLLAVLAVVGVQALFALADAARDRFPADRTGLLLAVVTAVAFGLLGIVDDLVGDHGDKGFGGHLRALRHGRLTTGGLKMVGGGLVALGVAGTVAPDLGSLLVGAGVIALAANTANLFDRAPGRVTKVALLAAALLVALTPAAARPGLVGVGAMVGAALGLLAFDLREELMLGDAGANPLGAVLGLGVVLTTGTVTQVVVLVVLAGVNLAGEKVSFSAVIARVGPLRALDQVGRRPR